MINEAGNGYNLSVGSKNFSYGKYFSAENFAVSGECVTFEERKTRLLSFITVKNIVSDNSQNRRRGSRQKRYYVHITVMKLY